MNEKHSGRNSILQPAAAACCASCLQVLKFVSWSPTAVIWATATLQGLRTDDGFWFTLSKAAVAASIVDGTCSNDNSGWYELLVWLLAYGRLYAATTTQICMCCCKHGGSRRRVGASKYSCTLSETICVIMDMENEYSALKRSMAVQRD